MSEFFIDPMVLGHYELAKQAGADATRIALARADFARQQEEAGIKLSPEQLEQWRHHDEQEWQAEEVS